MSKTSICLLLGVSGFLASCASTPKMDLKYYLPKSSIELKVVKSVTCDEANKLVFATAPLIEVKNVTDYAAKAQVIPTNKLDGTLANTSITVNWYDDGRLKGINSKSTGIASEALTSLTETFFSLKSLAGAMADPCTAINATKDKSVSFVYKFNSLDSTNMNEATVQPVILNLTDKSKDKRKTYDLESFVEDTYDAKLHYNSFETVSRTADAKRSGFPIKVKNPSRLRLEITDSKGKNKKTAASIAGKTESTVLIPKAALFGNTEFSLAIFPNGQLESISYGKESGIKAASDFSKSIISQLGPKSDAELALEYKNEADLIAQQQRLLRCQAVPADCT